MGYSEKQYDRATAAIHGLMYEVKTINERMALLHELSQMSFVAVVEIAMRDGFNIHELIQFIQAAHKQPQQADGKVINFTASSWKL